jgi:hypothetical protein
VASFKTDQKESRPDFTLNLSGRFAAYRHCQDLFSDNICGLLCRVFAVCPVAGAMDGYNGKPGRRVGRRHRVAAGGAMERIDVLGSLRDWFDGTVSAVAQPGFKATFDCSPDDRDRRSAWVTAESPARLGQLIVWDTGEAMLSLAEVSTGEVTEEHRQIASADEFREAARILLDWLVSSPG